MGKFYVPDKITEKSVIFLKTLLENGLVQEILHLGNLWRTKFLVTFDGFDGRESLSVDFMIKYILCNGTDEMLTLNWSRSVQFTIWIDVRRKKKKK